MARETPVCPECQSRDCKTFPLKFAAKILDKLTDELTEMINKDSLVEDDPRMNMMISLLSLQATLEELATSRDEENMTLALSFLSSLSWFAGLYSGYRVLNDETPLEDLDPEEGAARQILGTKHVAPKDGDHEQD